MAASVKTASVQRKQAVSINTSDVPQTTAESATWELAADAGDDVKYLLDQCETLVSDRNSWKQRAFDAERLIAELKMDKQELIRSVSTILNQN